MASRESSGSSAPRVVLDTNVVLDWLLFDDPAVAALSAAVSERRLCWIASPQMRDEFARVLGDGLAKAHGFDTGPMLSAWDTHVTARPAAVTRPLRCRDPDDQMFVDLALGAGARWLVSRDCAVLALRRRAEAVGLRIVRPSDWVME